MARQRIPKKVKKKKSLHKFHTQLMLMHLLHSLNQFAAQRASLIYLKIKRKYLRKLDSHHVTRQYSYYYCAIYSVEPLEQNDGE